LKNCGRVVSLVSNALKPLTPLLSPFAIDLSVNKWFLVLAHAYSLCLQQVVSPTKRATGARAPAREANGFVLAAGLPAAERHVHNAAAAAVNVLDVDARCTANNAQYVPARRVNARHKKLAHNNVDDNVGFVPLLWPTHDFKV
jgi:hypothetical protein